MSEFIIKKGLPTGSFSFKGKFSELKKSISDYIDLYGDITVSQFCKLLKSYKLN